MNKKHEYFKFTWEEIKKLISVSEKKIFWVTNLSEMNKKLDNEF